MKLLTPILILFLFSGCSAEYLFNKAVSKDRNKVCELAYRSCDNARDSIVITKEVEKIKYDTVIAFAYGSGGDVDTVEITDTLYLEDKGAKAKIWAYKNKLIGELSTKDSLKKTIDLYKTEVKETKQSFQKSKIESRAKDEKIKALQEKNAWKKIWRTIAIISILIIIIGIWLAGRFRK